MIIYIGNYTSYQIFLLKFIYAILNQLSKAAESNKNIMWAKFGSSDIWVGTLKKLKRAGEINLIIYFI